MFSRHIRSRQIRCFVCGRGMKHKCLRSLTFTNPYVVTDGVEFIAGLMYAEISGTLCQCRTGYRLPVDTEHCGQAQHDTGCLWKQKTVGRHSRIQTLCGHRIQWARIAGYRLPTDIENCGQAQQDTDCLWTQNTVGRHSRIQTACGQRIQWARIAGYRLPTDIENCGQAQQDTDRLWTQKTVCRHW